MFSSSFFVSSSFFFCFGGEGIFKKVFSFIHVLYYTFQICFENTYNIAYYAWIHREERAPQICEEAGDIRSGGNRDHQNGGASHWQAQATRHLVSSVVL